MTIVAMRTMAANLKQKLPVAVQRVFASSRAPGTSSNTAAAIDSLDPELRRRVLNDVDKLIRRNRRNDLLVAGAGLSFGGIVMSYLAHRLTSRSDDWLTK
ncbi:unnamed protein product [Triticum turgidum subsp. durum]|uniref:Uncharacterized protein n=1 Tax=Triticum turgidum subsp. durum TaxID=4567 RepID=A0A9R1Q9M2_TRITD|nr:unnamed protein product [Triticum turgidum subsp. durum]